MNQINVDSIPMTTVNEMTYLPPNEKGQQLREMDNFALNEVEVDGIQPNAVHISVLENGMMLICRQ